jgi:hydroxypyruvate reductase
MKQDSVQELLFLAFKEVLQVADPKHSLPIVLKELFPSGLKGNCLVIGGGKASAAMAYAIEQYAQQHWHEAHVYGSIITRYGHDVPEPLSNRKIHVTQAAHPIPDQAGFLASQQMMDLVGDLEPEDYCIALISGGGSSLLALPPEGVSLESLIILTEELLRSGAPIEEMNIIRKHVSRIQGGRMAQQALLRGANIYALIISDVTGDQPSDIASGPCSPDPSTFTQAIEIFKKYQLHKFSGLQEVYLYLQAGARSEVAETLKMDEVNPLRLHNHVFATAQKGLEAAAKLCQFYGYEVINLGDRITGEARVFAKEHAQIIRTKLKNSDRKKIAWISGGETTVTIPKEIQGRGGRCSEFLLALMIETLDIPGLSALAADTDGIDGSENNAGAFFTPETRMSALQESINLNQYLTLHDAYGFFSRMNQLVMTGPTLTNVNDFRIVLIDRNDETHTYSS